MSNHGNYAISLGNLCRWLATQAESMGVEIYPGFSASEILYDGNGVVKGVITGDMGVDKDGKPTDRYIPGMELRGKYTFFAEGVRGNLSKKLIDHFSLNKDSCPQKYAIGIKELWEIDPKTITLAWFYIPKVGLLARVRLAVLGCITLITTKCQLVSLLTWIIKTHSCLHMKNFKGLNYILQSNLILKKR